MVTIKEPGSYNYHPKRPDKRLELSREIAVEPALEGISDLAAGVAIRTFVGNTEYLRIELGAIFQIPVIIVAVKGGIQSKMTRKLLTSLQRQYETNDRRCGCSTTTQGVVH